MCSSVQTVLLYTHYFHQYPPSLRLQHTNSPQGEKQWPVSHLNTHTPAHSLSKNGLFWGYLVSKKNILDLNFLCLSSPSPSPVLFSHRLWGTVYKLCEQGLHSFSVLLSQPCYCSYTHLVLSHTHTHDSPLPLIFVSCPASPCVCKGKSKECFQQRLFL